MNKFVKRACENAIAVKSVLDTFEPSMLNEEAAYTKACALIEDIVLQELNAFVEISASKTKEEYLDEMVKWRKMIMYNSTVVGAIIRITKDKFPAVAAKHAETPIWDMVNEERLVGLGMETVKAVIPPCYNHVAQQHVWDNVLRKEIYTILMDHATDNLHPIAEEQLKEIVLEAGYTEEELNAKQPVAVDQHNNHEDEKEDTKMNHDNNRNRTARISNTKRDSGKLNGSASINYKSKVSSIDINVGMVNIRIEGYEGELISDISGFIEVLGSLGSK